MLAEVLNFQGAKPILGMGSLSKLYSKWERKLIEESTLHPVIEPKWECSCYYISPKGRNRYSSKRQYSLEEMKYYYDKNVEQEEKVCTKEYQRKLMTDSQS